MENAGDILYVLFIIAIGLFQYWRKQKEKAAKKAKPVNSAPPAEEKSFKEIIEDMMGGYEEESTPEPEAYEEKYVPEIETIPQSYSTETASRIKEKRPLLNKQTVNSGIPVVERYSDDSEPLDFDLRKAVIYTAIMEAKFKEY